MTHTPNGPTGEPGGERWPAAAPHVPSWQGAPQAMYGKVAAGEVIDRLNVTPAPTRRRRGLWRTLHAIAFVVVFFVGMAAGAGTSDGPSAPQSAQTPAAVTGTRTGPAPAATVKTSRPAAPAPTGPRTAFGDGTWEIGRDIAAGTYVADVPADSLNCYWQTSRDNSGSIDAIIANDNVSPGGRASLATGKAKWVTVTGCGTWRKR